MPIVIALLLLASIDQGKPVKDASGEIVELNLTDTWVSDADMAKVAQLRHLRKLDLSHTRITGRGMEYLALLDNVTDLNCYFAEYLTDDGIAHIGNWKRLERLNLRGTKVTSKVFESLAKLTSLRSLDISSTQIEDDGMDALSSLTKLESLAIGGNRLSGAALPLLKLLPSLVDLDVGGLQRVDSGLWGLALTDENLARLSELKQLRSLNLSGATLSDRGIDRPGSPEAERSELRDLSKLAALVNLERLDLSRLPVTAESLQPLAKLPKLRELRLGLAAKVDDSALPILLQIKSVYVSGSKMSPDALAKLKRQ
jgi:Leucine-rich repeat (LRR) protein